MVVVAPDCFMRTREGKLQTKQLQMSDKLPSLLQRSVVHGHTATTLSSEEKSKIRGKFEVHYRPWIAQKKAIVKITKIHCLPVSPLVTYTQVKCRGFHAH